MGNKIKGEIEENYEPTPDEIIKYGILLGLTLPDDEDLLYIARKSLKDPLPHPWKRCKTLNGDIYYFNFKTGQSGPQHPRSYHYKQWVSDAKCLKGLGNIKDKTKSLLYYQISNSDFNSKLKETKNVLNKDTLRNKTAEILSRPNNPELEMDFRATCSTYQSSPTLFHDPSLIQAYQDYLNAYQTKTSLYHLCQFDDGCNLFIYNTETETQEVKILKTPEWLGMASVYCFGRDEWFGSLARSSRFDLDQKRWTQLTPMPEGNKFCNSIIFNGNILISEVYNRNLLLYSIDINSFSKIFCGFSKGKIKILINADRLYLIECGGWIYESEICNYTNWRRIKKSKIEITYQTYYSYNKGRIYINCRQQEEIHYYKFDLNEKLISRL